MTTCDDGRRSVWDCSSHHAPCQSNVQFWTVLWCRLQDLGQRHVWPFFSFHGCLVMATHKEDVQNVVVNGTMCSTEKEIHDPATLPLEQSCCCQGKWQSNHGSSHSQTKDGSFLCWLLWQHDGWAQVDKKPANTSSGHHSNWLHNDLLPMIRSTFKTSPMVGHHWTTLFTWIQQT